MKIRNFLVSRALWTGFLIVSVASWTGCKPNARPAPEHNAPQRDATAAIQPSAATAEFSPAEAERLARHWTDALRASDNAELQKLAALPFTLREPAEYPKCDPAQATRRDEVPGALACLLDDKLFMQEMHAQPAPVTETVVNAALPAWAESLQPTPPQAQMFLVRLPGNGVSYQLLLVVASGGVASVWKHAEYDPN